jgi:hypothetical protein
VSAYTIADQCAPGAIDLWNRSSLGEDAAFAEVVPVLRSHFPTFCALLLKVKPKGGGRIKPFLFNQVQRRIWAEMCRLITEGKPLYLVILKFRQAGMSTFWCAWIFWQLWRQKDIQAMIVAHQMATAETMIETMRVFYDELPDVAGLKPELRDGNHGASIPRGELYMADRRAWCLIHVAKNVDPRGQQVTHVLETEYAMYPNPDELNGALMPQLPEIGSESYLQSSFVIESTPKGQNEFYELYHDSKKNTLSSKWTAIFVPWFIFDEQFSVKAPQEFKLTREERSLMNEYTRRRKGYDGRPVTRDQMFWRRQTIETVYRGDEERFNQEYPSDDEECFLITSKSVFRENAKFLAACVREATEAAIEHWAEVKYNGVPIVTKGPLRAKLHADRESFGHAVKLSNCRFAPDAHGHWNLWEKPIEGDAYVVGGDPASGLSEAGDPLTITIFNVTSARQVGEYSNPTITPERFADEMAIAGYLYNTALLIPEINNIGYVVLSRLIGTLGYPNLYKWPKFDEVNKYTNKRGWETNSRTKMLMISSMKSYFDERLVFISSRELLSECTTFEQKGDDQWEAQRGRHDDRVITFGLCLMAISQSPKLSSMLVRAQSTLPTARQLGLSAAPAAASEPTPIPKQIQELVATKYSSPWNPIADSGFW